MKKTGLYGAGLLMAVAGLVVSCGGDDGSSDNTGGSSSTSGSTSGGSTSSAGTTSGGSSSAGTSSSSGSSNGGSSNGGTNNQQGGDGPGPGAGGDGPGGADCPAAEPMDGSECDRPGGFMTPPCTYGETQCRCQGQMNNREWNCGMGPGGFGGDGPGGFGGDGNFGSAECPDNAMDGDPCTGTGLCAGQQCFCDGEETNCFGN
jgi:hypothetical protein